MSSESAKPNEQVLDAALGLLALRHDALGRIAAGEQDAQMRIVVRSGDLNAWMKRDSASWKHVLSTRPMTSATNLARSMANNRALMAAGLQMVSVFDYAGTEADARDILVTENCPSYLFGSAPVRMRLLDHERVYLAGADDEHSILSLSHPRALAAALAYWHAVMATATPCRARPIERPALTLRQRSILRLLADGARDEDVAARLGVSVRTVRTDIATAMEAYGVRTRVGLGVAYARGAHR